MSLVTAETARARWSMDVERLENGVRPVKDAVCDPVSRVVDFFDRDFYCVDADDPLMREQAYRIRYDVYCVEHGYENPLEHPGGLETDEFDSHAPHKLLIHRPSGLVAGVVRLILPIAGVVDQGLPFRRLSDAAATASTALPVHCTAEVSRFAIVRRFREHVLGAVRGKDHSAGRAAQRVLLSNVSIGLMRAVVELAAEHGMTHLCAVMEPALLRLLARLGVHFEACGPKVDHHGNRQPCSANLDALLTRTCAEREDIWEILTSTGAVWPVRRLKSCSP